MNTFSLALFQAGVAAGNGAPERTDAVVETADKAVEAATASGGSTATLLLYLAAAFILPFVVGHVLASMLKLKDDGMRMSVCLLALSLSLGPFAWHLSQGREFNDMIRRGIDLAGGTNLVYQIDRNQAEKAGKEVNGDSMEQMVAAISRRINVSGTEEVTVRQVGSDQIEVIVPGADSGLVAELKRKIIKLGTLEFGLLANVRDHGSLADSARALRPDDKMLKQGGQVVAVWRGVGEKDGKTKDISSADAITREVTDKISGETVTEYLVIQPPERQRITGQYLNRAYPTSDQSGRPAVGFSFDATGSYLFKDVTVKNRPRADGSERQLAILLDNKIHSAPTIDEPIDGNGIIRGDFTRAEINDLVSVLKAGALDLPLRPDPINEVSLDPLLGADVQEKGMKAIGIAGAAVVIFMLIYYRFAGVVAVLSLALNLMLVMGSMVAIDATFTLPGIAGLVLTIGMAVDANVLIFERIREETGRGSSLRMAIQQGFGRAFTTIVDANVTTLITAAILFMIGTDQVRGFAVTLIIGILMSMFTALYFGRLVFDIFERKRWITKLGMFSIVGKTEWDFIGKRMVAGMVSLILIGGGLAAFFARGTDNYDIDFTGGTMVTFQFDGTHTIEAVKGALTAEGSDGPFFGEDITVERLSIGGQASGTAGNYFRLRTRDRDETKADGSEAPRATIPERVNAAFAGVQDMNLVRLTVSASAPEVIVAGDGAADDPTVGGYITELEFKSQASSVTEVSTVTVFDNFRDALASVGKEYEVEELDALVEVDGLAGSGMKAEENSVRKFSRVSLRTYPEIDEQTLKEALAAMEKSMASRPYFDEVNSFAPSVASQMKQAAVVAIVVSLLAIVGYIWFRFQRITFGLAAVAALVHDVLVVLGMVALASYVSGNSVGDLLLLNDFKINLPMIAAFLTIVGYSLNDTIVVFDRIREVRGKNPALTPDMVNRSLNQTLSRTLLTSITTFIVVAILYAIGGEGIHGFAFCLVLGVVVGTYSSIFVASPVLLWLMNRTKESSEATSGNREKVATA